MTRVLLLLIFCPLLAAAQAFWTEVTPFPSDTDYVTRQISIVEDNVVWVDGYDPADFNPPHHWSRSIDSGLTWTEAAIDLGNPDLHVTSICGVTAQTAYVTAIGDFSTVSGGVWVTHDGGLSWTKQPGALFDSTYSYAAIVHFWDDSQGVVIGHAADGYLEIYTTVDAGENWIRVPSENIPAWQAGQYVDLKFDANGNSLWFILGEYWLFGSSDRGLHWSDKTVTVSTDFPDVDYGAMALKDESFGIYLRSDGVYARTSDAGETWDIAASVPSDETIRLGGIANIPQTPGAFFSYGGGDPYEYPGSSYTTDGGASWTNSDTVQSNPVNPIVAKFWSPNVGYCVGYYDSDPASARRLFRINSALSELLTIKSNDVNQVFATPNPTSGMLTISANSIEEVNIADMTGKIVFTSNFNGVAKTDIDVSNLGSGIYFAQIIDSGGAVSQIKMIKN